MCTTTFSTLTLACMLDDPLIQAVMRSDGVSPREHADLWLRVRDSLDRRAGSVWQSVSRRPATAFASA